MAFLLAAALLSGCATTYQNPSGENVANIKFVLKVPLDHWTTISFFEGLDCAPSPHGEHGGDLHNGSWAQEPSDELSFKIESEKLISMELFERTIFTAETVYPGQYCKNLLAFTPEKGVSYLIEYWPNCKYTLVDERTGEPVKTLTPTGRCHSKNIMGAYK